MCFARQCIINTPPPSVDDKSVFDGIRQTLSISTTIENEPLDLTLSLHGNSIIFDSFSPPNDVTKRNLVVNNISKVNDPSRQFNTQFSVNVEGTVSVVLHPDSVDEYRIVDKKCKQAIVAPNKHRKCSVNQNPLLLSLAATVERDKTSSASPSSHKRTFSQISDAPLTQPTNLRSSILPIGTTTNFMLQTFRMAPPPPAPAMSLGESVHIYHANKCTEALFSRNQTAIRSPRRIS